MTAQRFHVEHGSCAYFVVDALRGVAVSVFPYGKELHRGGAYFKAKCDMRERNEREQFRSRPMNGTPSTKDKP